MLPNFKKDIMGHKSGGELKNENGQLEDIGLESHINLVIIFVKMNRLVVRSARAMFSTLPQPSSITEAGQSVPKSLEYSFEMQRKRLVEENKNKLAGSHNSLGLNFAVEEDGKRPVIMADFQTRLSSYEMASYALSSLFVYEVLSATSSYPFIVGVASATAWCLAQASGQIMSRLTPKILGIHLLSDGNLEIHSSEFYLASNSLKKLTVAKEDFQYGVNLTHDSSIISRSLAEQGVWCQIRGQRYLIPRNHSSNQHLLHELL